jgi:hypothetical protein
MSDTRPVRPAAGSCHPLCPGAAAAYARLLAAHTEANPLLTIAGEGYVRNFLLAAESPDAIPGPFDPPPERASSPDAAVVVVPPSSGPDG